MVSSGGAPLPTSPFFQSLLAAAPLQGAVAAKHLELLHRLAPLLLDGSLPLTTNQAAPATTMATTNQAIVIHLENVLVPTKWMADRLGLTPTAQGLEVAQQQYQQTPDLQCALHAIEDAAIQLLRVATALGPVFLVSDATATYVEVFCSVFFPRLTALLRDGASAVQLLAAPSASLSLSGKAAWKIDALRAICCEKLYSGPLAPELLAHPQTGRFALVSLNAHDMDAIAATRAQQNVAPHAVLKMCKVASTSFSAAELETFHAQLGTLARFLLEATAQDAPIHHAL